MPEPPISLMYTIMIHSLHLVINLMKSCVVYSVNAKYIVHVSEKLGYPAGRAGLRDCPDSLLHVDRAIESGHETRRGVHIILL